MKGVSDNVISVARVMVLHSKKSPQNSAFAQEVIWWPPIFFPILESPSDFLLSLGKKRSLKI